MCVIMSSLNTRVTEDQLKAGFKENPWGGGIAWIDKDKDGPVTRWKKGISTIDEFLEIYKTIKGPYVAHFRIPTEGLEDIALTHPFCIDADATSAMEGSTKGRVLFHNGGMGEWRQKALAICSGFGVKLPKGLLNDSRIIAWMAHHYGEEELLGQIINEKTLVFGLNDDGSVHYQLYGVDKQNGWNFKGNRETAEGIWFSNDRWEKHMPRTEAPIVQNLRDIKRLTGGRGGDHHNPSFQPSGESRPGSTRLLGRPLKQEQVEGRKAPAQAGTVEDGGKLATSKTLRQKMAQVHQDEDQLAWAMHFNPKGYTRRSAGFLAEHKDIVH